MTQMANAGPVAGKANAACPNEELLAAYVCTGLNPVEHQMVDQHVRACPACTQAVAVAVRRIRIADEIARPVPVAVADRVAGAAPERSSKPPVREWRAALAERFGRWLRLPVLAPVAVAALALMVVVQQQFVTPELREKTRAIETQDRMPIAAASAAVYVRPSTREAIVATLHRGTIVQIHAAESDWYRVTIPDGREGWMERRAFESEG